MSSPKGLLWLVALAFFMSSLDATIVNTALPALAASLGESPLAMHSVVMAYSLTLAVLIPASGWVADRFGVRRAFLAAILIFTLGSGLCALAQNLTQLVGARMLQGVGGCLMMPIGRLAVLRAFPGPRFLEAMSFVAVPGLLGPLLGPPLGGWLVEIASWHWIFLINLPIGLVGWVASWYLLHDGPETLSRQPFDGLGFGLLAVGMVSASLALNGWAEGEFGQPLWLGLALLGGSALGGYVGHARRARQPLFPLALLHTRSYRVGLAGNFFARLGSSGTPFLIPLMLQVGLGYSPGTAGLMMLPVAASAILAKRFATLWIRRWGYRQVLIGNTLLVGLLITSFALISPEQPQGLRLLQLGVFGLFNSLQFTAMNTLTLKDLPSPQTASGNSLFSMIQRLAMGVAAALAGVFLQLFALLLAPRLSSAGTPSLLTFQATFVCLGLLTCASSLIFRRLTPDTEPGASATAAATGRLSS
ncbi:MAG: multidrug transporter subunit MdtD [Candidatus Sericytochromatia bacterium]